MQEHEPSTVRVGREDEQFVALPCADELHPLELVRLVVAPRHAALAATLWAELKREQERWGAGADMLVDLDDATDDEAELLQLVRDRHHHILPDRGP